MKRILLRLSVTVVMLLVLLAMAVPAFAAKPLYYCYWFNEGQLVSSTGVQPKEVHIFKKNLGATCTRL